MLSLLYFLVLLSSGVLNNGEDPKSLTKEDWKSRLTSDQYNVCRKKGTERVRWVLMLRNQYSGGFNIKSGDEALFNARTFLWFDSWLLKNSMNVIIAYIFVYLNNKNIHKVYCSWDFAAHCSNHWAQKIQVTVFKFDHATCVCGMVFLG